MKKRPVIEMIPDAMRENLDFLGHIYCPAKELLNTKMTLFMAQYNKTHDKKIKGIVPMGSCGVDIYYNIATIKSIDKYPSIMTDNGYGEFFDDEFLYGFGAEEYFEDIHDYSNVNVTYSGLNLKDPKGIFNIYSVMPYVMLINTNKLGDRPLPESIKDLLNPCYNNSIVTGHEFDNIDELLLLQVYKRFGEDGIRALASNLADFMNNVKMVQTADRSDQSYSIFILPYFFAKAAPKKPYLKIVWPSDGALMCPLYTMTKKNRNKEFDALLDYIYGKEFGQALANNYFPHVNSEVDNKIPGNGLLQWVGWDYLYEMNITKRVRQIEAILYEELDPRIKYQSTIIS